MSVYYERAGKGAPFFRRPAELLRYDGKAPVRAHDGLTGFSALWAIATMFSLAADPFTLSGFGGQSALMWGGVIACALMIVYPRSTRILTVLAALSLALYAYRLPVASNNKTIAAFTNASILLVMGVLTARGLRGEELRETAYERLRVMGRGLLAVMYIYGIFHKINTDFLDPNVSCAVGLYKPLATPFGLGDNIVGKYLAIYSTFVIEAITLAGLYWRRFFAIGFILALVFHYIIPISAYSWYMDFSSLVFALYMLSIPKMVSQKVYADAIEVLRPIRRRFGRLGVFVPAAIVGGAALAIVALLAMSQPDRKIMMAYHSVWVLVWAIIGGVAIVFMSRAAIEHLPYRGPASPRQPAWPYLMPIAMFLMCLSPYLGLKTESSINMFSNLHTEGGVSNHLMMPKPPYVAGYQNDLARITDSNDPRLKKLAATDQSMVMLSLKEYLRNHPNAWVSYERNGEVRQHVTTVDFAGQQANFLERNLLVFKTVDWKRPKVCTH